MKRLFLVALLFLTGCAGEQFPEPLTPVPSLYVEPEPFDFCPGGVLVRDPSAGIKEDCDLIEYPNGTREKVNCVWFDDAVLHYRCVNATMVLE